MSLTENSDENIHRLHAGEMAEVTANVYFRKKKLKRP